MSYSTEKDNDVGFSWGMKRKQCGTGVEIQYVSFTFGGVEYFLYDCVYLYKDGEPEPYIGKLIRIWEDPIKGRKVLVLWFFRPSEISNHLRCENVLENELFLASGNGVGLANENSLEAIAGKCNVVCISKDVRNRKPSDEEIKRAEYIFYRVFDVEKFSISDKLGERISSIEVRFLLNKKDFRLSDLDTSSKEDGESVAVNIEQPLISVQNTSPADEPLEPDCNKRALVRKYGSGTNLSQTVMSLENQDGAQPTNTYPASELDSVSGQKYYLHTVAKSAANAEVKGNKGSDKFKCRDSVNMSDQEAKKNHGKNITDPGTNNGKHPVLSTSSLDRGKSEFAKDFDRGVGTTRKVKLHFDPSKGSLSKKPKLDNTSMPSHKNGKDWAHTYDSATVVSKKDSQSAANVTSETSGGVKLAIESNDVFKKLKSKVMGSPKTISLNSNLKHSKDVQVEAHGHDKKASHPPLDRRSWLNAIPWDEKMKDAQNRSTLVLLQNLDPAYTSSQVEKIVWHAFKIRCTAKMIQRTAISSSYLGEAFVAFDTREAAEKVIKMFRQRCLILPNGRPVVCRLWVPKSNGKRPPYPGHLECRPQRQTHRESKAISTSHSSQSNTVEYDMALEWRVLQKRSDFCWKKLHQEHEDQVKKLASRLKRK